MTLDNRQRRKGQPLKIRAADYNSLVAASKETEAARRSSERGSPPRDIYRGLIRVQNKYGRPLERYEIVQLSNPFILPGLDASDFLRFVNFKAEISASLHGFNPYHRRLAVVLEPIQVDAYGMAVAHGLIQAFVNLIEGGEGDHFRWEYFDEDGDPLDEPILVQGEVGPIEILWGEQISSDFEVIEEGQSMALVRLESFAVADKEATGYVTYKPQALGGTKWMQTVVFDAPDLQPSNANLSGYNASIRMLAGPNFVGLANVFGPINNASVYNAPLGPEGEGAFHLPWTGITFNATMKTILFEGYNTDPVNGSLSLHNVTLGVRQDGNVSWGANGALWNANNTATWIEVVSGLVTKLENPGFSGNGTGGDGGNGPYTTVNSSFWDVVVPGTVNQAIDRLANAIINITGIPIPNI